MAGRSSTTELHTAQQLLNFAIFRSDLIGLTKSTILPFLGVHGGLSLIAYGISRATDRVELKDYLWPTGMILNAWWAANTADYADNFVSWIEVVRRDGATNEGIR